VNVFIAIGGISGLVTLLAAIIVVGRSIFRAVSSLEDNTSATRDLTEQVERLKNSYQSHETRISILEDRIKR
jgi:hypothetical protein